MISVRDEEAIAARLVAAYDAVDMLQPITQDYPGLDVAAAYRVLHRVEVQRVAQGWQPVGRKIGFTNTTIWARYGVYQPMWAHIWRHTVHRAPNGVATLPLKGFVQPRIEPEVVFGLEAALPASGDPAAALACVAWMAAGFEIVQSHFPEWRFTAADCTAAFGLHGALVVGAPVVLTPELRANLHELLPRFQLTLRRGADVVDRGVGSNVLGGPAHALAHLAAVLAGQPWAPPLARGEIVTTGTLSDAWPVAAGETWTSEYGALPVSGLATVLHLSEGGFGAASRSARRTILPAPGPSAEVAARACEATMNAATASTRLTASPAARASAASRSSSRTSPRCHAAVPHRSPASMPCSPSSARVPFQRAGAVRPCRKKGDPVKKSGNARAAADTPRARRGAAL